MPTGTKIKEFRKKNGLTQKQLGDLCGLADSAIRRYENGNANPKIETLQKIANALNVHISDLLDSDKYEINMDMFSTGIVCEQRVNYKTDSPDKTKLLNYYDNLNKLGKKEAIKRVSELTEIQRYTVQDKE